MSRYPSDKVLLRAMLAAAGLTFGLGLAMPAVAAGSAAPAEATASDSQITAQVKQQLADVEGLKGVNVGVKTADGVVTLTGTVKDRYAKSAATTAVLSVEGVKVLDDELKVGAVPKRVAEARVGKDSVRRTTADDRITADVKQLLAQSVPRRYKLAARTDHGVVYLSGDVMDGAAIERLKGMVAKVDGVKHVNTSGLDAPFVTMNF